jgi:bacteriocin-like protein
MKQQNEMSACALTMEEMQNVNGGVRFTPRRRNIG